MQNEQKEIKLIDGNKLIEQLESFKYLEIAKDSEEIGNKQDTILETLDNCIELVQEQQLIFESDVDLQKGLIKEAYNKAIEEYQEKFRKGIIEVAARKQINLNDIYSISSQVAKNIKKEVSNE